MENGTDDVMKKTATIANAHDFIMAMEDGYETKTGQRGIQLSRGQKQRVTIAITIAQNRKVLILDEAISALDQKDKTVKRIKPSPAPFKTPIRLQSSKEEWSRTN